MTSQALRQIGEVTDVDRSSRIRNDEHSWRGRHDGRRSSATTGSTGGPLDVERDSDVPISTQIYWQLAYQIDSGRLLPGTRLPPVRELGGALRVNPNTIRAVYRRLADADYVTSRHGAGTHVAERPPQRRGTEALAGIVSEIDPPRDPCRVHRG